MYLHITNFGQINAADLLVKKLNVITGENNSGKTNLSKLLYCILTSLSCERDYLSNMILDKKSSKVCYELLKEFESINSLSAKLKNIIANLPQLKDTSYTEKLEKSIISLEKIINESDIYNKDKYFELLNDIKDVLENIRKDNCKFFEVSNALLNSEFRLKEFNLEYFSLKFGEFINDECEFSCKLSNEPELGFRITDGDIDSLNIKNVIYLDSQSIFNLNNSHTLKNQNYHLKSFNHFIKQNNEDINLKSQEFIDKITSIIGGYIFYDYEDDEFKFKKETGEFSMENTSSGVKLFGIIQRLLFNGTLNENSFIIIDEPEVYLHPYWQFEFAEILVLMIKKLDISVYINSNSPLFIEALEVFSAKYGLSDDTTFHLAIKISKDEFNFEKISRDDIVILYNNLGDTYKKINKIRAQNMRDDLW